MSNSAGPKITKDGLVLDFDAANPKSYKPSSDPYFSAVSLLLSMNGANGSTTFTDSSPNGLAVTAVGNAQISTAQSKYGGSAGYFDGTGDYLTIPYSEPLNLTTDYTIEFWMRSDSITGYAPIFTLTSTTLSYFGGIYVVRNGSTITFETRPADGSGSAVIAITGGSISANTWYHIAATVSSNNARLFIDGIQVGSTTTFTPRTFTPTGAAIGRFANNYTSGLVDFQGYIDDLRISQFARYLSNFTPPNTSLPAIASTVPYDPYYIKTSLLLHMDGANGSTTFTDSGPNALAVTAVADAKISTTQSKFGGSAAYFDGTGDYLTVANNAVNAVGLGDFTIECWVNFSALPGTNLVMGIANTMTSTSSATSTMWWFGLENASGTTRLRLGRHGDGLIYAYFNWTPSLNTWYHIAVTRSSSSVISMFINGISQSVTTSGSNWANDFSATGILSIGVVATTLTFNGYIDDFRITKGIARYKSNFTPPTTALVEYAPEDDRYFNNVSLLLHADGANNSTTFIDNSSNGFAVTVGGNAKISTTQSKFGGSSAYFDGDGDYLTATSSTLFQFSGDFTVEFWAYSTETSSSSVRGMFDTRNSQPSANGIMFRENGTGYLVYGNATILITTGAVRTANAWVHLALVRNGSTITLYVNGTSAGSATNSTNYSDGQCLISGFIDTKATPYGFLGYIEEFKITKGIARYTSNFTIPSSAYPNNTYTPVTATAIDLTKNKITGTFTNGVDYSAANGGSLVFDGVDDYVNIPASTNLTFGTGDFTMEVWCKTRAKTMLYPALLSVNLAWASNVWVIIDRHNATSPTKFTFHAYNIGSPLLTSSTATSNGVWYNVVITRIGTLFSMYINGVLESTATSSASLDGGVSNSINLGRQSSSDSTYYDGNIPIARVYKGKGLTSTEVYNNFAANRGRFGV